MPFSKQIFFLLTTVIASLASVSGQTVVSIKNYSTVDGLADNKITSAIQDRDGFMWFGSWAGISRFDGENFVNYKSYPGDKSSLKSNRIDVIVEDKEAGFLWVKAYDNQIYRFDKSLGEFEALPKLLGNKDLSDFNFTKINSVGKQQVWLTSSNKGLVLIQDALGKYPKFKLFNNDQTANHKLPVTAINAFHQDRRNVVWIATNKGAFRLKPTNDCDYNVETVKALPRNNIQLMDDGENLMWFAQANKVFAVDYNGENSRFFTVTKGEILGVESSPDRKALLCSTSLGELISISEDGTVKVLAQLANPSALYGIFKASNGDVYVQSKQFGVVRYGTDKRTFEPLFPVGTYLFDDPLPPNFSIFEDESKTVWIALDKFSLMYYDSETGKMGSLNPEPFSNQKLSKIVYHAYYFDKGVIWMTGDKKGADKLLLKPLLFFQQLVTPVPKSQTENEVRGMFADGNKLWLGTKAEQVKLIENGHIVDQLFDKPVHFDAGIYAIKQDNTGAMWFGTKKHGLFRAVSLDSDSNKYLLSNTYFESGIIKKKSENSIYSIFQDSKKRLWAGSYGSGIILFPSPSQPQIYYTLDNAFNNYPDGNFRRIRHIAEDGKGNIWLATTDGLIVFDPNKGTPKNFEFKVYQKIPGDISSLGGNDVQFIFRDSKMQMWVLTSSGGLNLALGEDPLKQLNFKNFSVKNGLPSDYLLSCAEDNQQNLWIATQNGLCKFSINTQKVQNFNYFDGLSQRASFSEAAVAKLSSGVLVFGTTEGLLKFDPAKIENDARPSNLVFTQVFVNGEDLKQQEPRYSKKDISYLKSLKLNHAQNILSFQFAVLDYFDTEKQNFACRLIGYDGIWRSTDGQRKITYTNLPPGKYKFQVKCLNEELYSPSPIRSVSIVIMPPFWKTWWAYAIYFIVFVGVLIAVQRTIITMLKLRHGIELERKMATLKMDFFTQISHELRTPLTLIVNPIAEVLHHEKLSERSQKYLDLVLKNAKRMARLVNQLLDLRKVQSGKVQLRIQNIELVSFIKHQLSYFEEIIAKKSLTINLFCPQEHLNGHWDLEKLEIVLYNIIGNAIKYSPPAKAISINLEQNEDEQQCTIKVQDEGPGVKAHELSQIFDLYYEGENKSGSKSTGIGLALAKEMAEVHGGTITASNASPSGLVVTVQLPTNLDLTVPPSQSVSVADDDAGNADNDAFKADTHEKMRLLIVEDNEELRAFMELKFEASFAVSTAQNGAEGLEKARSLHPDLILSDVMMPVMDGLAFLQQLKADDTTSHIPVILLTAKTGIETHILGLRYGADYYLPKPFDTELLNETIRKVLQQRATFFNTVLKNPQEEESVETEVVITEADKLFLKKVVEVVQQNIAEKDFNIDTVADLMNMSRSAFFKKFKSLTNLAPVEFVRDTRLDLARNLLADSRKNISEIAYATGFNNPKYFSTCFKAKFGLSPKEYQNSKPS
ncbi:two-component regulator propeller domain-containing protein [Pelobium manganitolerans]|uniref:two-component regulator propeller domain-containing protein n=1 Tax=Pelobium manganitolerans TaxID=1842495 RepID=UPI003FA3CF65